MAGWYGDWGIEIYGINGMAGRANDHPTSSRLTPDHPVTTLAVQIIFDVISTPVRHLNGCKTKSA